MTKEKLLRGLDLASDFFTWISQKYYVMFTKIIRYNIYNIGIRMYNIFIITYYLRNPKIKKF